MARQPQGMSPRGANTLLHEGDAFRSKFVTATRESPTLAPPETPTKAQPTDARGRA